MRTYTAKGPHKRPCDLCGLEVQPGDRMTTWCFVSDDGPEGSDIMRVHETCHEIQHREGFDSWRKGWAFQASCGQPCYGDEAIRDEAAPLQLEAKRALDAARLERAAHGLVREAQESGLLAIAITFAVSVHGRQLDKGGRPYVLHPLRVMSAFSADRHTPDHVLAAAVLHDVVEDCAGCTVELMERTFGAETARLVDLLTRHPGTTYRDYVRRIADSGDAWAARIKLADIADNSRHAERGYVPPDHKFDRVQWAREQLADVAAVTP